MPTTRKMRYLNERSNGSLRYVRDYPLRIIRTFPKHPKQFSRELGLNNTSTDTQLHRAMEESHRAYDLQVKMAENSDPEAFTESEKRQAVDEILRQRKLNRGDFANQPEYSEEEWKDLMQKPEPDIEPSKADLADGAIPEFDDVMDDHHRGKKLTFRQEVMADAWFAVQKFPEFRRRKTMREAWSDYVELEGLDTTQGDGKDKQQRFERVVSYTGDFLISDDTKDDVLDRLQNFISGKQRDNPSIKPQSIERELAEFKAAIRMVPRLSWRDALTLDRRVNNVTIAAHSVPLKARVLTDDELKLFFKTCVETPDEKWTALLVASHAGLGMREIRRLRPDKDLYLEAASPHIIFRGGEGGITKTAARPRVVPIVIGLDVVKQWLPKTIQWMNKIDENSASTTLNKRLRQLLGKEKAIKSHGFRHTWLRLCRRARISEDNKHAIAGWEKGDTNNALMTHVYDPSGFEDDPELIEQLYQDQQDIFHRFK